MDVAIIPGNFKPKDFNRMSRRTGILFSITAFLLVPILLGMTPLNFVHKMGSGCPFSQGKQALKCNPCPFHSIVSHDDPTVVNLSTASLDQELTPLLGIQVLDSDSIPSNITFNYAPMRC
jgi:hypothetical protein